MTPRKKGLRCVVIHGHFYQPPRENPWIEAIEHQPSAGPHHHDWNERIAWECYIPNAIARIVDDAGRIVDLVNNYAWINFDMGPTLLSWYQAAFPKDYGRLLEADRLSRQRFDGHGNAIAQAYNHTILPLDDPRDADTQIRWGLADFRYRFGREPEGIWLPEAACNAATLERLIAHGVRYSILSTDSAQRVRPIGAAEWSDASGGRMDPRRPYRWFAKDADGRAVPSRFLDLFFFDGPMSRAVAFEGAMRDAGAFAARLEAAFDRKSKEPQIVSIATDGESYGHHERFADMGLARLITHDLPQRGIEVVNYAYFLTLAPPTWEVEIKAGPEGRGTSWSCAHGVERWRSACGCGGGGGTQQTWRAPLRAAFDWLRGELAAFYEAAGRELFTDPWAARDGYIEVLLDRRSETIAAFLQRHGPGPWEAARTTRALQLLDMQRHALLMYTSCAWFFEEVSRLEPVQNLKYAARAMQLAEAAGGLRLEAAFVERLAPITSNLPMFAGGGRAIWGRLVRPALVTPEQVTAQVVAEEVYEIATEREQIYHYRIEGAAVRRVTGETGRMLLGRWRLCSGVTQETWTHRFAGRRLSDGTVEILIQADGDDVPERVTAPEVLAAIEAMRRAGASRYGLPDLFGDERRRILTLLAGQRMRKMRAAYVSMLADLLPLATSCAQMDVTLPRWIRDALALAARYELIERLSELERERQWLSVGEVETWLEPVRAADVPIDLEPVEPIVERMIGAVMDQLEALVTPDRLAALERLVHLADVLGCARWRYRTENRMCLLVQALAAAHRLDEGSGTVSGQELHLLQQVLRVAEQLSINVTGPLQRLMAWDATAS